MKKKEFISVTFNNFSIHYFREYKEALRQQRANEGASVYRPREQQVTTPSNDQHNNETDSPSVGNGAQNGKQQIFGGEETPTKRPVLKVTPSRINYPTSPIVNGEHNNKNGNCLEQPYKKPSSPVKTSSSIFTATNSSPPPRLVKTAVVYMEGK